MISTKVLREERNEMGGRGEERMRGKVEGGGNSLEPRLLFTERENSLVNCPIF